MQNSGVNNAPQSKEQLTAYEKGWAEMMVDIWHEQMASLKTIDTGRLYSSVRGSIQPGDMTSITHAFVEYGFFVNQGTGREYNDKIGGRNGENGQLDVLDGNYRYEHNLDTPRKRGPKWGGGYTSGEPRQKKPWFDKKYIYSLYRLREVVQASYGEQYQGMTIEALNNIFQNDAKAEFYK